MVPISPFDIQQVHNHIVVSLTCHLLLCRFNYRSTHHLVSHGFYNFLNWFDERAWYPLGRIVGGTVSHVYFLFSLPFYSSLHAVELRKEKKYREGINKVNMKMQSTIMACKWSACRLLSIQTFCSHFKSYKFSVKWKTSLMIYIVCQREGLKLHASTRMLLVAEKDGQKNKCMHHG